VAKDDVNTLKVTAILLCGGRGERLRPFTDNLPKPLVPLEGQPLLGHLMLYLAAAGIRRFAVCVGYRAELIREFLRAHADPHWQVECIDSGEASMTDRIMDAAATVGEQALICYGDTLANVDVMRLRADHRAHGGLATVTVHPFRSPFGIVQSDESSRVSGFLEKPLLPYWINIGFLLCEKAALGYLRRGIDMPEFLDSLARDGVLFAYRHQGRHITVNTERDRETAEAQLITIMDSVRS